MKMGTFAQILLIFLAKLDFIIETNIISIVHIDFIKHWVLRCLILFKKF